MRRASGGPDPLIAVGRRRLVAVGAALGAATAALLGDRYEGTSGPGRLDVEAAEVLSGWPATTRFLVYLGDPGPLAVCVLLVVLLAVRLRRGVFFALLAPPIAVATTAVVLKPLVGRTLGPGLAYPSTHMTGVSAVLLTAAVLVAAARRGSPTTRGVVYAALACLGLAKAATLSALGFHYATDTVGGAGVAVAVVLTAALLHDVLCGSVASHRLRDGASSAPPTRPRTGPGGHEAR